MTTQDLIDEIQTKNPQISKAQILERLEAERSKCNGLLGDETLLRLIAAKFGVQVQQNSFSSNNTISSGRLFGKLYDVNVVGRRREIRQIRHFDVGRQRWAFAGCALEREGGVGGEG
jgi:hypothetical protein